MSNSFECEYCNKSFTIKYNMLNHQKTTKKCIELQKLQEDYDKDCYYLCKYCNYKSTIRENYHKHFIMCCEKHKEVIEKYEIKISEKDKEINEKEQTIIDIKMKNRKKIENIKRKINFELEKYNVSKLLLNPLF
jgi:hypothetical protein